MVPLSRRSLLVSSGAALLARSLPLLGQASGVHFSVADFDRARILARAETELLAPDLAITEVAAPGARDRHRFFCDAKIVPADDTVAGFTAHADLLLQMVARVAALVAAWRLDPASAAFRVALRQVRTWCVAPQTQMLPTLEPEASSSSGKSTDGDSESDLRRNPLRFTNALAEFARSCAFLCAAPECSTQDADAIRAWFAYLLQWLTDSARGVVARDHPQQDSIFWTAQASELARFTRNDTVLRDCTHRFRDKLLRQLHLDGYLPYSLQRRRPYAESMFLLECLASACESISTPFESAWSFTLPDGRSMRSAVSWAAPLLRNRGKWPYLADVRSFSEQPLRENALLFAGRAYDRADYIELWQGLRADTANVELRREHPITQPALWAVRPPA